MAYRRDVLYVIWIKWYMEENSTCSLQICIATGPTGGLHVCSNLFVGAPLLIHTHTEFIPPYSSLPPSTLPFLPFLLRILCYSGIWELMGNHCQCFLNQRDSYMYVSRPKLLAPIVYGPFETTNAGIYFINYRCAYRWAV